MGKIKYIATLLLFLSLATIVRAQEIAPENPSEKPVESTLEERLNQLKKTPKSEPTSQGNAQMYATEGGFEQQNEIPDTIRTVKVPKGSITEEEVVDTIAKKQEDFYIVDDSLMFAKGQGLIHPAATKKKSASHAAFLSALVPGLGQIYSGQQIWMVPLFWGGLVGTISAVSYYNGYYNDFRGEYKYRINNNITDPTGRPYSYYNNEALVDRMQYAEQQRDLWIIGTVGVYLLNVLHANVSVQLSEFRAQRKLEKQRQYELQQQSSPTLSLQPTIITPNKGLEKGSTPGVTLALTF